MYNTSQMGNTMDVYNHVTDQERIVREIAKLDEVQVRFSMDLMNCVHSVVVVAV